MLDNDNNDIFARIIYIYIFFDQIVIDQTGLPVAGIDHRDILVMKMLPIYDDEILLLILGFSEKLLTIVFFSKLFFHFYMNL